MIVKLSNKTLKQPIEFFVDDKEYEMVMASSNKDEINRRLLSLALKHISRNGYSIGCCSEHKREVTLADCMRCGISKGWGRGNANLLKWEQCKQEKINYQFSPAKVLTNTIKDKRIEAKMNNKSKTEIIQDKHTISEVVRNDPQNEFDAQSEQIMEPIKDKENKM